MLQWFKTASKSLPYLQMLFFIVSLGYANLSYALPSIGDETIYFRTITEPVEVEYSGDPSGLPRANSGANYFSSYPFAGISIPLLVQPRFVGPQTAIIDLEGYVWNTNWGWISLKCSGGQNRGVNCSGDYRTQMVLSPTGRTGYLKGSAWNESIGEIKFDRNDWPFCSPLDGCTPYTENNQVQFNLSTNTPVPVGIPTTPAAFNGFAWNDHVGWMYFEGVLNQLPTILGLQCGNSTIDAGEQCDDGNGSDFDNCLSSCSFNVCGDGHQDIDGPDNITGNADDEQCDDDNNVNGDLCSSTCKNERPPSCGDGVDNAVGEECDDGHEDEVPNLSVDYGACIISPSGLQCLNNICGDGYRNYVTEACDDGNRAPGDGCDNVCQLEPPTTVCGDGVRQANGEDGIPLTKDDEQCDDGNANNGDSCTNSCKTAACGDGFLRSTIEQCDDGNKTNGDGCSSTCRNEASVLSPVCGDKITQVGEVCDNGSALTTQLACNGQPFPDGCNDATCTLEGICGDGDLNPYAEQCDDGNLYSGDGCTNTCVIEASTKTCGNGLRERIGASIERCDDGNILNGDGCSSTCQVECTFCGDGVVDEAVEACDDGNRVDTDTCRNNCMFGDYSVCGDGFVTMYETCDDGNRISGDSCPNTCSTNIVRNTCGANDCTDFVDSFNHAFRTNLDESLVCELGCGNGYLEGSEECDDGNILSGDGCSSVCADEIVGTICGNGSAENDEECDDGNLLNGDGCSENCTDEDAVMYCDIDLDCEEYFDILSDFIGVDIQVSGYCNSNSYCGDGTWDEGEECDFRDVTDPYLQYCNSSCVYEVEDGYCGDGHRDAGEECDDGNFKSRDGCTFCDYDAGVGLCGDTKWSLGEECDSSYSLMTDYYNENMFTCDQCELNLITRVCGDGNPNRGEECDDGTANGSAASTCTTQCTLKEEPASITCFPEVLLEKGFDSAKGDIYNITVDPNCIEEESEGENWNVSIGDLVSNFSFENTIDCNQTDATSDQVVGLPSSGLHCTFVDGLPAAFEEPVRYNPLITWPTVGQIYSYAPTGFTSELDTDNRFVLNRVKVKVTDASGATLFEDFADVERELTFRPKVIIDPMRPLGVKLPSSTSWQTYFNFDYTNILNVRSAVQIFSRIFSSSSVPLQLNFNISGGDPYMLKFDIDSNIVIDSADSVVYQKPYLNASANYDYGFVPGSSNPGILDKNLGYEHLSQNLGLPTNESLTLAITYKYDGRTITYPAGRLPDAESLRQYNQHAQILGPVDSNKLVSAGAGIAKVGALGESVKRGEIKKRLSTILENTTLLTREPVTAQFAENTDVISSSNYEHETVGDKNLYYFKGDVLFNGELSGSLQKSIVVDGANIYINENIEPNVSTGETSPIDIIALSNDAGEGGNIFIGPNVTYVNAHIFADGSIMPYNGITRDGSTPDWQELADAGDLDNQIVFKGSLVSNNTIGGADNQADASDLAYFYRGDGSITTAQNEAKLYDLNYFRRHGLKPGSTDAVGNPRDCNGDSLIEMTIGDWDDDICDIQNGGGDLDFVPIGQRYSGSLPSDNYPVYFYFSPKNTPSLVY